MLLSNRISFDDGLAKLAPSATCLPRLFLLAALCLAPQGARNPAKAIAANDGLVNLSSGTSVVSELAGGVTQQYEISLRPGEFLQCSINKGDLGLSLVIYSPAGRKLVDQESHVYEVLDVSLTAESAGIYRLEVRSLELANAQRPYELKIDPIRSATETDRKRSLAGQAIAQASLLKADWTEISFRKALEKIDEAALLGLSSGSLQAAAVASMEMGKVHFVLSEYSAALDRYQKATANAKRAGAKLLESEGLSQIGLIYCYLGDNDKAQSYLAKAVEYYVVNNGDDRPTTFKHAYAETLTNLGELYYSKGNLVKSLEYLERSLKFFTEVEDRRGEARVRLFIGYIAGGLGEPEKALAEFSQAQALFRASTDKRGEALALTALGLFHSLNRKEEHAISMHAEARDIFRTIGDRQSEAITLNAQGQAFENLSQYETALDNYKKALKLSRSLDFSSVAIFKIARVYRLMGDRTQALAYYQRCANLSRLAKKTRTEANALNDVAAIYASQGSRQKTVAQYEKILKFYRTIGDRRGQAIALNNQGDFLLRLGENKSALSLYKQALPLSEQAGEKGAVISTLYNIARATRDSGSLEDALPYVTKSIKIIEDLRSNVASPDFRTSYFAGVRKHYDLSIDILMQLDRLQPGKGFAAAALLVSERARARSLIDVLTQARADVRQGVDPKVVERERELQSLLRSQAQYQMDLSISGKLPAETAEVIRQIDRLMAEYHEIQAQLRDQNLLSLTFAQPLSLEDIQRELGDDNTMLLEYALGDERSHLWAVTANSLRSYELPSRAVLEKAGREVYKLATARQAFGGAIAAEYQANVEASDRLYYESALKLSDMLLGQVAEQLGNKRLVFVTEGVLQYIPLDALPTPAQQNGMETRANDPQLVITMHEVVTLPSISTLAAIRREKRRASSRNKLVAVLADPVFNNDDDRVPSGGLHPEVAVSNAEHGGATRLGHASEEADAILAVTPRGAGIVAKGFDASRETAMSSLVGQYQILHLATHGFINSERPEFSGIVLTMVNRDGSKANGFMPLQDIYNLSLSADLTVLSACDTALGKEIKGEGLIGLTRGFMHAGSRSVVASLWKVDDRATSVLMAHFYKAMLQDGMPPAAALRFAKETLRKEKSWRAPYFWAGFVLQGEYNQRLRIETDNGYWKYLVGLLAVALMVATTLIVRRRRRALGVRSAVRPHDARLP